MTTPLCVCVGVGGGGGGGERETESKLVRLFALYLQRHTARSDFFFFSFFFYYGGIFIPIYRCFELHRSLTY